MRTDDQNFGVLQPHSYSNSSTLSGGRATATFSPHTTIGHNPSCSKSRSACALIAENGITAEVVEYLQAPPTKEELRALLKKLDMKPAELVRQEAELKEPYAGRTLPDEE